MIRSVPDALKHPKAVVRVSALYYCSCPLFLLSEIFKECACLSFCFVFDVLMIPVFLMTTAKKFSIFLARAEEMF